MEFTENQLQQLYYKYQGERCGYKTFKKRVLYQNLSPVEAIKPGKWGRKTTSEATIFYKKYQGQKCKYTTFKTRVVHGKMTYEEAINPSSISRKKREKNNIPCKHSVTNKKNQISFIDITLKPEEASVFRAEYEKLLAQLQYQLEFCEIPSDVPIITEKIKQLKEEIRVFNLYN